MESANHHFKFPLNSFSISKSYLKTIPSNNSTTQTFVYSPCSNLRIDTNSISMPQNKDHLNQKLKSILNHYKAQEKKKKKIKLKSLYSPMPHLTSGIKSKRTSTKKNNTLSTSEIINIVNKVSNSTTDKKIDLKMNINQYDIKYYLRSDSKNEVTISDIENNNNAVKADMLLQNKYKHKMRLKKKLSILDDDVNSMFKKSRTIAQKLRKQVRWNSLLKKGISLTENMPIRTPTPKSAEDSLIHSLRNSTIICKEDDKYSKSISKSRPLSLNNAICPVISSTISPKNKDIIIKNSNILNCLKKNKDEVSKEKRASFQSLITKGRNMNVHPINDNVNNMRKTIRHETTFNGLSNAEAFQLNLFRSHKKDEKAISNQKNKSNTISDHTPMSFNESRIEKLKDQTSILKPKIGHYTNLKTTNHLYDQNSTFKAKLNRMSKLMSIDYQKTQENPRKKHTVQTISLLSKSIKDKKMKKISKDLNLNKNNEPQIYLSSSESNSLQSSITQNEASTLIDNIIQTIKKTEMNNDEMDNFSFHSDSKSTNPINNTNTRFYNSIQSSIKSKILSKLETHRVLNCKSLINVSVSFIKSKIDFSRTNKVKSMILESLFDTTMKMNTISNVYSMQMKRKIVLLLYKNTINCDRNNSNGFLLENTLKELILKRYFDVFSYLNDFYINKVIKVNKQRTRMSTKVSRRKTYFSSISFLNQNYQFVFDKFDNYEYVNKLISRDLRYHIDRYDYEIEENGIGSFKRASKSVNDIQLNRSFSIKKKPIVKKTSLNNNTFKHLMLHKSTKKKANVKKKNLNDEKDNELTAPILKTLFKLKPLSSNEPNISTLKKAIDFHMISKMAFPSKRIRIQIRKSRSKRKKKIKRRVSIKKKKLLTRINDDNYFNMNILKYIDNVNEQIIYVIREKNIHYLQSLLKKKEGNINLQYQDAKGNSFVHWAVIAKSPEICEFLIEKGSDYNLQNVRIIIRD